MRIKETENVSATTGESLVLGPGQDGVIEATLSGLDGASPPDRIILSNNDPWTPERTVNVLVTTVQYQVGDLAPEFALPAVNFCETGDCDFSPVCIDSGEVRETGRPIFLAFFSSW